MLFLILSLLVQAALIVHVIRSGRNSLWIWAIALLPAAGSIAYVVVELIPGLLGSRTARRASARLDRLMDPDRELRLASAAVEISGNVEARRRLASELYQRGDFQRAQQVYREGLTGIFEHDPTLLVGLARAEFAGGAFAAARLTLERLRQHNPEFNSADAALMYAQTLAALGDKVAALREYAALVPGFPGAEAKLRYALLLRELGRAEDARTVLQELLASAQLAPAHYRKAQAEWLERARRELG